jgi:hypothetical protein
MKKLSIPTSILAWFDCGFKNSAQRELSRLAMKTLVKHPCLPLVLLQILFLVLVEGLESLVFLCSVR